MNCREHRNYLIETWPASKSNTILKRGGLMNPLKGDRFDIHFHRRDAEHAKDLFNFLLSAEGAENKNQQPLGASICYCQ